MLSKKQSFGTLFVFGLLLAGCETTNPHETLNITAPVSSLKANKNMHPQVAQAFLLLKQEKYSEASTFINQALQTQPKSVILHILNALTYEKLAELGDATGLELAVVGYQNAVNLDPFNSFAVIQLGKIKYREQQYDQAQEHFANALLLKPNDPDLLHEFAAASYYSYDIKAALAAIKRAEKLKPEDPLIQRSAAMMHAAVGNFKDAEKHFKVFQAKLGKDPEVEHVANRFNDWQTLYKSGRLTLAAASTSSEKTEVKKDKGAPSADTKSSSGSVSGKSGAGTKNTGKGTGATSSTTTTTTTTTTGTGTDGSTDTGTTGSGGADTGSADSGTASSGGTAGSGGGTAVGTTDSGGTDSGTAGSGGADTGSTDSGTTASGGASSGTSGTGASNAGATSGGGASSGAGGATGAGGGADSGAASSGGAAADEEESGGLTVDTPPAAEGDQATQDEFKRGDIAQDVVNAPVTPGIAPAPAGGQAGGPGGPGGAPPPPMGPPASASPQQNQQIVMDCYILQITEASNTSKGNNILDALAVTLNPGSYVNYKASMWGAGAVQPGNTNFGGDKTTYNTDAAYASGLFDNTGKAISNPYTAGTFTSSLNNVGSVSGRVFASGITWAGLTYSLNIANAADLRTEIVSRPTLMTFLNKEARFFSGTELVNVSGGNYGSNLSRYQVGVTLAITPESLVGERLSINIGVESSLLQNTNPNLLQTVDVSKTRVETTARVRLGETIMLGGIYERTEVDIASGFPGLRDVPLVQYFFSNQKTISDRRSIVILLTPRSPDAVKSAVNRAMARESVKPHFDELVARNPDWFSPDANATKIFSYANIDPVLYYEFRTGDVLPPSWGYEPAVSNKLAELSSFLYY